MKTLALWRASSAPDVLLVVPFHTESRRRGVLASLVRGVVSDRAILRGSVTPCENETARQRRGFEGNHSGRCDPSVGAGHEARRATSSRHRDRLSRPRAYDHNRRASSLRESKGLLRSASVSKFYGQIQSSSCSHGVTEV